MEKDMENGMENGDREWREWGQASSPVVVPDRDERAEQWDGVGLHAALSSVIEKVPLRTVRTHGQPCMCTGAPCSSGQHPTMRAATCVNRAHTPPRRHHLMDTV